MGIRRYDDVVTNNNCLLRIAQVSKTNRPYLDIGLRQMGNIWNKCTSVLERPY